jgi:hypothetical protein
MAAHHCDRLVGDRSGGDGAELDVVGAGNSARSVPHKSVRPTVTQVDHVGRMAETFVHEVVHPHDALLKVSLE